MTTAAHKSDYVVAHVLWQDAAAAAALRKVRSQVFIQEQQVPPDLEWDGLDENAQHFLARDREGQAIGSARLLLHDGRAHIGRMAVLPTWRRQGVGTALLTAVLETAKQNAANLAFLNAQISAAGFYAKAGFIAQGHEFLDAGIPHIRMELALA